MRSFTRSREAVRVKVKKYDGKSPPDIQKFSVDPQITSLDVLQSILIKAFNLKDEYSLSYRVVSGGQDEYIGLLSDWDLDAAFLRAQNIQGSEPCVHLRVDIKNQATSKLLNENISSSKWLKKNSNLGVFKNQTEQKTNQVGFQGIFMNQMERTINMVSRALNFSEEIDIPVQQPLNDTKFRSFLDPVGQVTDSNGLRHVIYSGGIDPSLRRVVWKHILNVYPDGMSGKQRMDYMKRKSLEYYNLRDVWRDCIHKGQISTDLMYVTGMVKKDVLRTDRHHKYYAGSDDNQNIASLFNLLTTYALNHPQVSYCQGMSDLASPLLVTMGDEAHAYICFCALMCRLYPNFMLDGEAMTLKFSHLTESLQVYDPQFYSYLKNQQADDLLFCYRWLLLEMKREFAFDDALKMLEVLWSSLPSSPPTGELSLIDQSFCPIQEKSDGPLSPLVKNLRENAYTKLCAMRRQHSAASLYKESKAKSYKRMNQSLDENIGKKCDSFVSLQISKEFQSLDDNVISQHTQCDTNLPFNIDKINPNDTNHSNVDDKYCNHNNTHDFKNHIFESDGEKIAKASTTDLRQSGEQKCIKAVEIEKKYEMKACNDALKESEHEDSSPDDSKDYSLMTTSVTTKLDKEYENFDKILCSQGSNKSDSKNFVGECSYGECDENINDATALHAIGSQEKSVCNDNIFLWENPLHENIPPSDKSLALTKDYSKPNDTENVVNNVEENKQFTEPSSSSKDNLKSNSKFFSNMSQELENAKKNCEILLNHKKTINPIAVTISNFQNKYENYLNTPDGNNPNNTISNKCEQSESSAITQLPPPHIFGGGNPFLMFLCLTLLIQHRDHIMNNKMDYNELAMHFDKMVRKHNVNRVLNQARQMYTQYLKHHNIS